MSNSKGVRNCYKASPLELHDGWIQNMAKEKKSMI